MGSVVSDKYLQSCTGSWPPVTPGCRCRSAPSRHSITVELGSTDYLLICSSQPCYPGKKSALNIWTFIDQPCLMRVGHSVAQMICEARNGFLDNFCCSSMYPWQWQCSKIIFSFVQLITFSYSSPVWPVAIADTKAEAAPVFNRVATRTPNLLSTLLPNS